MNITQIMQQRWYMSGSTKDRGLAKKETQIGMTTYTFRVHLGNLPFHQNKLGESLTMNNNEQQ